MKKYTYFLSLIIASTFLISCDGKDEANEILEDFEDQIIFVDTYFSFFVDDTWRYNVAVDAMPATKDTLTVVNDQNAPSGFAKLEASPSSTGFMTGLLGNGFIKVEDSQLIYQGSLSLPIDPDNPIDINIGEVIVYDEEITQDVNGFPLTVDIIATSRQTGTSTNYTVNSQIFDKAIHSSLVVTATISTEILGLPIILLNPQEVLLVENTFGINVGLVSSTATLDYEFVDLTPFGITLPFPPTATSVSIQEIDSYEVTADDN